MEGIFGMCCVNRSKDDLRDSQRNSISKPLDYIRTRPGLARVLKWFDEVEDKFRESMHDVQDRIEHIIEVLDQQCDEEIIELSRGHEVVAKVVDRHAVADVLNFGNHRSNFMQNVIETIEFFRVDSNSSDAVEQYDFNKIILFCLLFMQEREDIKASCLFFLMCDQNDLITNRNGQVKTIIAMLTIISCMIPAEIIKTERANSESFEDMQEFDHLYLSYCTQPNIFNKFNSYMKNSKLFVSMRGPLNLQAFKELMHAQKYIFIDAEAIRAEYTYFVCFQNLPEHAQYFNRATFQSQATSYRETIQSAYSSQIGLETRGAGAGAGGQPKKKRSMAAARETLSQYENEAESMKDMRDKRGSKKPTRGAPLQDKVNRQNRETEDSISQRRSSKDHPKRILSTNEEQEDPTPSEDGNRKSKKSGKRGSPPKTKGKPTKKGHTRRGDSEESKSEENFDSETEHHFGNNQEKEDIDILADESIPVKKNKKAKGKKKNRYEEEPDSDGDEDMDMVDSNVNRKKNKNGKTAGGKEDLDRTNMSYRSYIDRSSVKSTVSRKRQMTIEDYIGQQFGSQFYELVVQLSQEQQAEFNVDNGIKGSSVAGDRKQMVKRDKRFKENRNFLLDPDGFEMPFPSSTDSQPTHVKEVFKYLRNTLTPGDLVALHDGETSEESLINVYYKILEKINLVLLKASEFLKVQQNTSEAQKQIHATLATQKVLYCNTNFLRELMNCAPNDSDSFLNGGPETDQQRKYHKIIKDICDNEVVLIPYYPERTSATNIQNTPMLVELHPKSYQATLYMKAGDRITESTTNAGDTPTPTEQTADMISEEVMKIFTNCAKYYGEEFSMENVDGGTSEIFVTCEEDYMVGMAYVADCHTYKRVVDLEKFDVERERNKMVDLYLSLLKFK